MEADIYRALAKRIGLFHGVVGQLQPILAKVSGTIAQAVLEGRASTDEGRAALAEDVDHEATEAAPGIDIDEAADTTFALTDRPASSVTMDDLDRVIRRPELLPDGFTVQPLGPREYSLTVQGRQPAIRITTDADYFERHADSVELWSPGGKAFPADWSPAVEHQQWPAHHDSEGDLGCANPTVAKRAARSGTGERGDLTFLQASLADVAGARVPGRPRQPPTWTSVRLRQASRSPRIASAVRSAYGSGGKIETWALAFAAESVVPEHLNEIRETRSVAIAKTEVAVKDRLTKESRIGIILPRIRSSARGRAAQMPG